MNGPQAISYLGQFILDQAARRDLDAIKTGHQQPSGAVDLVSIGDHAMWVEAVIYQTDDGCEDGFIAWLAYDPLGGETKVARMEGLSIPPPDVYPLGPNLDALISAQTTVCRMVLDLADMQPQREGGADT